MKKRLVAASILALSVTLGGGTLLAGNVLAASTVQTTPSPKAATKSPVNGTAKGKGFEWGGERGGERGAHARLDNAAIATLLGVTENDLKTAEQAGKSLAVIAGEKGVAVQSVVDLVSKQLTTNLDKQLADGKITQSEYDTQKANLATIASEIVNRTFTGKGEHGNRVKLDNAAIATLLGVTENDLKTAEQAGKSLAVIAGEKGVAVQSVVDLVSKQLTTNLDKQLADGKITQSEYDKQKANLATIASEIVNRTFTGKGEHGNRVKLDNAAIATLLGVTETDLKTAEQAGKSLAAIAGEKGVAVQTVVDLVSKQLTTNLDKQLADGKITQAEYDTQKAKLATIASEIVNRTFVNRGGHDKFDRQQG